MTDRSKVSGRRLGGLLVRRQRWGISTAGKLLIFTLAALICFATLRSLNHLLAITDRIPCRLLVVDGWLPTWDLERAAAEYQRGTYDLVLAVRSVTPYDSAELGYAYDDYVCDILVRHGVPRERINPVLFPEQARDRTLMSALAVGEWCSRRGIELSALNLVTLGPHARRSRFLYRQALGDAVAVGVIGLPDPWFDADHWWRSSEGVREVLFEGIAYIYVRLFPPTSPTSAIPLINIAGERSSAAMPPPTDSSRAKQ